jgi:hypothetical protein
MATYSELEYSSITDLVVPFSTYNGIDQYSTGTDTITGYTLGVTQFTFTPVLSTLENTGFGASLDKMIWDFGDGTYGTGYSVTKQYQFPGDYKVTTIFTDQNGETHRNSKSQKIKVYNYVPDALQWYTPNIVYPNGALPEMCHCGCPSDDLTIFRYNSWQSWPMVSGEGGYFINLYAMGSQSMPLSRERYYKSPDIHFAPTWRFVEDKKSTEPLERAQTDNNTAIYVKVENGKLVHTTVDDPDGEFAGTSGIATVNYIDDMPNRMISRRPPHRGNNSPAEYENDNLPDGEFELISQTTETKDIILYASFDTSKFPVTRYDKEISEFETLKQDYFQIYETQKIGLPIIVKFNEPDHLNITSNGIQGFEISQNKYLNSPISFCAQLAGRNNFPICATQVPELSSYWLANSTHFSGGDIATDVLTGAGFVSLYLSGADTTFSRVVSSITSDDDFKYWDVGKFLADEPVNSYVKLNIVERCAENDPEKFGKDIHNKPYKNTPNTVTILAGNLDSSTKTGVDNYISGGDRDELILIARTWTSVTGESYYATLNGDSTYATPGVLDMEIQPAKIPGKAHGAYNALVNVTGKTDPAERKKYRLVAETIIEPSLYFNYETLYYYMANPSNDFFHQIKPVHYRNYTYGEDGFTQTYTSPLTTTTPGNSGLYSFAVEPLGDVIMVDGDTDKIIRYWRNTDARAEIQIHTLLPGVSANHYPGNNDEYGYSPSSVSLDSNLDYWVTLYDAVSTIKLSGKTNEVIAVAVPPVRNFIADSRTTAPSSEWSPDAEYNIREVPGAQGYAGENIVTPTVVETCLNNDIVVTYSNPLCSFMVKYDKDGNYLSKTDFGDHERYFTGDMCIDASDHVWAVTDTTGLNPDGTLNLDPPEGKIYSYDEQLNYRLDISTVSGAAYQDIQSPTASTDEEVTYDLLLSTEWDYISNEMVTNGFIISDFGPNDRNPTLAVYEGNTYIFDNKFYNRGQNATTFRTLIPSESATYRDIGVDQLTVSGSVVTENITGADSAIPALKITASSPDTMILVNDNFPQNRIILDVKKKPIYVPRDADTFDIINNPSYVIPDCNNNIWFSWGRRFCSRYNTVAGIVDTTVAVGSAYNDPRYNNQDESTHDRRDNAGRDSAIEGLGMDTGNNLLVVNNVDKRLYALYSDSVPVSAYVNIPNNDQPVKYSLDTPSQAVSADFILPGSYLTDAQIEVFLNNASIYRGREIDAVARQTAVENYLSAMNGDMGNIVFRTENGLPGDTEERDQDIIAGGDWTGFKWINKYDNRVKYSDVTSGSISLTGQSEEFQLLPQTGSFDIVKINENVDFAEVVRQYVRIPSLTNKTKFYDDFLNTVFGTGISSPISLGKRIYERIANYGMNHNDVDTCTLQALLSLADMTNYKLTEFGTTLPVELQRVVDILSIKYTKLKGTKTNYQTDFEKYGNWDQSTIGVNLGAEIMFIYEYDKTISYKRSDFVRHDGKYYQAISPTLPDTPPVSEETDDNWRYWPDGYVRGQHLDDLKRIFGPYMANGTKYKGDVVTNQWIVDKYETQNIIIKLKDKLRVGIDEMYVLCEDSSSVYSVVEVRAQNFLEQTTYDVDLLDNKYVITNPGSADQSGFDEDRRHNEIMSDVSISDELISFDDGLLTVMSALEHQNPTLILYRNRTYKFKIDSMGDGVEIVPELGGEDRLTGFVAGQGTELGTIILRTDDDEIHGPIPETIYYRSVNDRSKSGMIIIKDVNDVDGYSTEFRGVTAYNIDITYNSRDQLQRLGWGVDIPDGANAWQFYSLYEYNPTANAEQYHVGNVIDWTSSTASLRDEHDGGRTTIEYDQVETFGDWSADGAIADIVIEKTLRDGLSLFDGLDPVGDHYK